MKKLFILMLCAAFLVRCGKKPEEQAAVTTPATPGPVEFADPKYMEIGKAAMANLSSGNIDAMIESYADNARYQWSSGDSVVGKQAILTYWKDRRGNVIDSLTFTQSIWLPIKVNQPQSIEQPGVWLLSWNQVAVKYKNGKKIYMWIHTDYHFDANDKIDQAIQYLDRAPINAALAAKK